MSSIDERVGKLEETIQALDNSVKKLRNGEFESLRVSKRLVIFDGKSQPRILLAVDSSGDPTLCITNADGKPVIMIGTDEESSAISVNDSAGRLRLKLTVPEEADPMVVLTAKNEEPQLSLSVVNDLPRIMLHDADGAMRIATGLDPVPNIVICGKDEEPRILLSLTGEDSEICILDEQGRKMRGL
jgi:hypothetical protein